MLNPELLLSSHPQTCLSRIPSPDNWVSVEHSVDPCSLVAQSQKELPLWVELEATAARVFVQKMVHLCTYPKSQSGVAIPQNIDQPVHESGLFLEPRATLFSSKFEVFFCFQRICIHVVASRFSELYFKIL